MCNTSLNEHVSIDDGWGSWTPGITSMKLPDGHMQYTTTYQPLVAREEFEILKKEVLEIKELLSKTVKYDKDTNQNKEKLNFLKMVASSIGIDLNDVLDKAEKYDGLNK